MADVRLSLAIIAAEPQVDDSLSQRAVASGMTVESAAEKRGMFASAARRLIDEGVAVDTAATAIWVPGRIEIAGKHTDYAGGRSLLAATSKGFTVVSTNREDDICRIFTCFGLSRERRSVELRISKDLMPEQGHWSAYPATAIRRLARNFDITKGVDIALECDLPEASGMSTSSAVICYMWMVLAERNCIRDMPRFKENLPTEEELYSYLGFIENGQNCGDVLVGDKGVGTFGGSEDHTAIMSCQPCKMNMFSYCPTKHEGSFDFPADATFVIAVSGALAEKTGGAMESYNNAAFLARDAAAAWCESTDTPVAGPTFVAGRPNLAEIIRHVRAASGGDSAEVRKAIGETIARTDDGVSHGPLAHDPLVRYRAGALRERFEQFFDESEELVTAIANALATGDYEQLSVRSAESHRQTVEVLRNTVPATAWLPDEARRLGALGASAFGAGFGGSCWAIVRKDSAEDFSEKWRLAYHAKFPEWADKSVFFSMLPGPGAFAMK